MAEHMARKKGRGCHCAWMDISQIRQHQCDWFVDLSAHDQSEHIRLYHYDVN